MLRRPELVEALEGLTQKPLSARVFRATRRSLKPDVASRSGGRWMPPDRSPVLYTSLVREGALAEMAYRQRLLDPIPTKPILVHRLDADLKRVIEIRREDLARLGIAFGELSSAGYDRSQEVGDIAYRILGCDGLVVPNARWKCSNLVVFEENLKFNAEVQVVDSEEVDWVAWAAANMP